MSNDELEEKGLVVICSNCNSSNIRTVDGSMEGEDVVEMCFNCGAIDFTKPITEAEYEVLLKSETIQ